MFSLGILTLIIGICLGFAGFLMLLGGATADNPKKKQWGANLMIAGAVSLLISFTLCTNS